MEDSTYHRRPLRLIYDAGRLSIHHARRRERRLKTGRGGRDLKQRLASWLADIVPHHPDGRLLGAPGVVVGLTEDGFVAEALDRGEHQVLRPAADLASLIQNIGHRRGGYTDGLCHISNGQTHKCRHLPSTNRCKRSRPGKNKPAGGHIKDKKMLDNSQNSV